MPRIDIENVEGFKSYSFCEFLSKQSSHTVCFSEANYAVFLFRQIQIDPIYRNSENSYFSTFLCNFFEVVETFQWLQC